MNRLPSAIAALVLLLAPALARAQEDGAPVAVVAIDGGAPRARSEAWARRVKDALGERGFGVVDDLDAWGAGASPTGTFERARMSALAELEAHLTEAREHAVGLREADALRVLSRAEALAENNADLPGSAAWLAEVHTTIGIVAAQAGLDSLAESALLRAATMDASRGVRAAEAPPAIVDRAARIARSVATGPSGTFEVIAGARGARVHLDDVDVGEAPVRVRAAVGEHVLRVEAPGHLPWGRVIPVLEGRRAPVRVVLAPAPESVAVRELAIAARGGDFDAIPAALVRLAGGAAALGGVVLVEAGGGARDRAVVVRCDARACGEPVRLDRGDADVEIDARSAALTPLSSEALRDARAWLREPGDLPPPIVPETPWWRRWYVLAGAGVAAIAATTIAVVAAQPDPEQRQRIVIDTGEVLGE